MDTTDNLDHLLVVIHGMGSHKLKIPKMISHVKTNLQFVQQKSGLKGKFEVIGVEWHDTLHSIADNQISHLVPDGITSVRKFINETALDIVYWLSPTYRQVILNEVGNQLNQRFLEFKSTHPNFNASVSIIAHSLGSVIIYDLLCHQKQAMEISSRPDYKRMGNMEALRHFASSAQQQRKLQSEQKEVLKEMMGHIQTGKLHYPELSFEIENLFTVGSPISLFLGIQGITPFDDNALPVCKNFYNIFHPYDPIAYRIEPWIDKSFFESKPLALPVLNSSGKGWWKNVTWHEIEDTLDFLGGKRYDHVLQLSVSLMNLNQYTSMIPAHKSYWKDKDLMFFVASMLKLE